MLAMLVVLLLGAVPAHAAHAEHGHHAGSELSASSSADEHLESQDATDRHSDAAIHCGAPILGPDPVSVPCATSVAPVVYFSGAPSRPLRVVAQDPRPPRR